MELLFDISVACGALIGKERGLGVAIVISVHQLQRETG
jgi:hypothetical protein